MGAGSQCRWPERDLPLQRIGIRLREPDLHRDLGTAPGYEPALYNPAAGSDRELGESSGRRLQRRHPLQLREPSGGSTNNQAQHWSAEIWVKPQSGATSQAIVSADDNWALRFAGAQGFACATRTGSPWNVVTISGGPVSQAGQWYHVVCSYSAGTIKLYVNAAEVASQPGVAAGQSGNGNFRPGYVSSGWTSGSHLNGTLDEFSFYKSALSAARVSAHYAAAGG